ASSGAARGASAAETGPNKSLAFSSRPPTYYQRQMRAFFRRIWTFVRPYRQRLFLGLICGVFYALTSGTMMVLVKLVVNASFPGSEPFSMAKQVGQLPELLRPLAQSLVGHLPQIKPPTPKSGQVMLICTLPVLMLLR